MSRRAMPQFSTPTRDLANRCDMYRKGKNGPFYADFRPFAEWGGKQEALVPPGERRATRDRSVASALFADRLKIWQQRAESGDVTSGSSSRIPRFGEFVEQHLQRRAQDGWVSFGTMRKEESALRKCYEYFGNCSLLSITRARVATYIEWRRQQSVEHRGRPLSNATLRNDLHALASLLDRAVEFGYAMENVALGKRVRPAPPQPRKEFLERDECARLLDAAFELDQEARVACRIRDLQRRRGGPVAAGRGDATCHISEEIDGLLLLAGPAYKRRTTEPILEAITSLLLYTGIRHDEALGLLVDDIDFDRDVVCIRNNEYRTLKNPDHAREIPMWPGLRTVMEHYLVDSQRSEGLLFPSMQPSEDEKKRPSISKAFARLVQRAGLGHRAITPHTLRHTFATQMLRTTVRTAHGTETTRTPYDVKVLLGHKTDVLVQTVYAHAAKRKQVYDSLDFESERRYPAREDEWRLLRWQEPALPPGFDPSRSFSPRVRGEASASVSSTATAGTQPRTDGEPPPTSRRQAGAQMALGAELAQRRATAQKAPRHRSNGTRGGQPVRKRAADYAHAVARTLTEPSSPTRGPRP